MFLYDLDNLGKPIRATKKKEKKYVDITTFVIPL